MSASIRVATVDDAGAVAAIYGPIVRDTFISFETEVPTVDEIRARVEDITNRYPWLICEIDGAVVGYAYGSSLRERIAYRWSVEMAVYIADGYRGWGVGKALSISLMECLRLLGFRQAFGRVALPNPASVGLIESLGGRATGIERSVGFKSGEWVDVGEWQMELSASGDAPAETLAPAALYGTDEWERALQAGLAGTPAPSRD